jgi:4-amino-4-deoxy-L-arabinose transferase-like glycosyltransferase
MNLPHTISAGTTLTTGRNAGNLASVCAALLLALMAVLSGGAALRESATVDEVSHIGAGVSYVQKLDLRMNVEHPPLPKVLAAIPLVLRGVHADYHHISWTTSETFFPAYLGQWVFGEWVLEKWNDPPTTLKWARLPMLLLTLGLGWAVFACARRLGGPWGGLLSLVVFVSTPAFLAFGPLVHTDIAVTLFSLLTLWTFADMWREPHNKHVFLFALCLAGALLSKFTAGILFLAFAAFVLCLRWRPTADQPVNKVELRNWRRSRRKAAFKGILWAALLVYAFYFIFSWNEPTTALERLGTGYLGLFLRRLLFPALRYISGLFLVLITGKRPTFLLGHAYPHGVWFYFPVVFVFKSSLGFLGLLIVSVVAAMSHKWHIATPRFSTVPQELALHWRILWISLLVFTGICLLSPLDLSIRHFSVPMVLMIVLLAPLPNMLLELRKRNTTAANVGLVVAAALAASCLVTAVRAYPFYFPYVNPLSMGRPVYALVNDSNVDWNQSLPEVQRFAQQHGLNTIRLDQYGFNDLSVKSVVNADAWDCQHPTSHDAGQWVALSANLILDSGNCQWVLQYPHEVLAGGSVYAMQLPSPIPEPGTAGGPPLPSQTKGFVGLPIDIRGVFSHLQHQPEDLPRAIQWMQVASTLPPGSTPPNPPWVADK